MAGVTSILDSLKAQAQSQAAAALATTAALTGSITILDDYLNNTVKTDSQSMKSNAVKGSSAPGGSSLDRIKNSVSSTTLDAIKNNPIVNAGIDTVNQYVTTAAQNFVSNTLNDITNRVLTPIENATQKFFTVFAQLSVLSTEVWMQIARNSAKNIVADLKQRDAVVVKLNAEIIALYNACNILLNGQPYFNSLLKNIIDAYALITSARDNVSSTVKTLQKSQVYRKQPVLAAQTSLTQAKALLLPPPTADISSIRNLKTLGDQIIKRKSNVDSLAAAIVIPEISVTVGKLVIEYSLLTLSINARINTFVNALDDVITGFKKNSFIQDATIAHLNGAISQMNGTLAEMDVFTKISSTGNTDIKYRTQVSTNTVKWGIEVTSTIEWLKLNPAAGAEVIDQTGESVKRYMAATAAISAIGDKNFSGGTVIYDAGIEDFSGLTKLTVPMLYSANLILAKLTSRNNIRTLTQHVQNYLGATTAVSQQMQSALSPFINTPSNIISPADKIVGNLIEMSNKLGLDRIAGLFTNGSIGDIFNLTPFNSTYAGAAVASLNNILHAVTSNPNATDEQVGQIAELKSQFEREKVTKDIEASRSTDSTTDAANAALSAHIDLIEQRVAQGKQAAEQTGAISVGPGAVTDPAASTVKSITSAVPSIASAGAIPMAAKIKPNFIGP